jgi:hypothetical protein
VTAEAIRLGGGLISEIAPDCFTVRGAHLEAMREKGLRIERPGVDVRLAKVAATDVPPRSAPRSTSRCYGQAPGHQRSGEIARSVDLISRSAPREQLNAGAVYVSAVIAGPGVIGSPGGIGFRCANADREVF